MAGAIGRIPGLGGVSRDRPSEGLASGLAKKGIREDLAETDSASRGVMNAANERSEKTLGSEKTARNEKVEAVAKLYEKQFLREMFKAMRATVKDTESPSMAQKIYRDQLDDQYIEAWGDHSGVGLSDIIYKQIMERYFTAPENRHFEKQGPIELTDRDVSHVMRLKSQDATSSQVPLRIELEKSSDGGATNIKAPWSGEVLQNMRVGERQAVTLDHGLGLKSTLLFDGVAAAELAPGKKITRGATVGVLNPEARSFLWNLQGSLAENLNRTAEF